MSLDELLAWDVVTKIIHQKVLGKFYTSWFKVSISPLVQLLVIVIKNILSFANIT